MATLQKLRDKGPLLAIVIGVALLLFILGDFLMSGNFLLSGSDNSIAVMDGEAVDYREYDAHVNYLSQLFEAQSGGKPDEQNTQQIRAQAWNLLIEEYVLKPEYEKLGLTVSDEEIFAMIFDDESRHPLIQQYFTDQQTGAFNRNQFLQFYNSLKNDTTMSRVWNNLEEQIARDRLQTKYNNLVAKGLYVTTLEAQQAYNERNITVDIRVVGKPYVSLPDSAITQPSEDELAQWYEENSYRFITEVPTRSLDYVTFDVLPSLDDTLEIQQNISAAKDKLTELMEDSMRYAVDYINNNSDVPYNKRLYGFGDLSPENDTTELDVLMFTAPEDSITIYGPYQEEGTYKLACLVERIILPDSVRARHILLPINQETPPQQIQAMQALADSLKTVIEADTSMFAPLAAQYGNDGTRDKGGDLGWFEQGAMVQPFSDSCFYKATGDVFLVGTQFGLHIVEITGQAGSTTYAEVGFLVKNIVPSKETNDKAYNIASSFAATYTTAKSFDEGVAENNLQMKQAYGMNSMQRAVSNLPESREIVRWAFNDAEVGMVSEVFECGDRNVVCKLAAATEKGIPELEAVKDQVIEEVVKQKKAEKLAAEMQKALQANKNLDALAENLKIQEGPQEIKGINFSMPQLPNIGAEPKVLAIALNLEEGQLSAPIKGRQGVYVLEVVAIQKPESKTEDQTQEIAEERQRMKQMKQMQVQRAAIQVLMKLADIEDNRVRFF